MDVCEYQPVPKFFLLKDCDLLTLFSDNISRFIEKICPEVTEGIVPLHYVTSYVGRKKEVKHTQVQNGTLLQSPYTSLQLLDV